MQVGHSLAYLKAELHQPFLSIKAQETVGSQVLFQVSILHAIKHQMRHFLDDSDSNQRHHIFMLQLVLDGSLSQKRLDLVLPAAIR